MKSNRGEESLFLSTVREIAKENGWLYYHTADSRRSPPGYPDVTLVKGDTVIFAELKSRNGRVKKAQKQWIEALKRCDKVETYLWRPDNMGFILRRLIDGPQIPHM